MNKKFLKKNKGLTKIQTAVLIAAIIIAGLILVLSLREPTEEFVRIGAVLHLTGDQAEPAQAFLEGINLAVEEINKSGGILQRKIKLIVEDDGLKPEKADTAAVKLINIDKISAGINASFLESMANGPTFEQAKVPVITLWDSAKEIEDIGDFVFGIGIWTPSAGESAALFAYNDLNLRKMVIVNILNEWSQSVSKIFKDRFEELGGEIIETYSINPGDSSDFRTTILKIKQKNPEGIYSPITDGVTVFYKQLKELGFEKPIVTSDIITENHIDILGTVAEGIYQTQASDPIGEKTSHLKELYCKKYNKEPKQTLFIAWGYDAVYIIKQAIETGYSFDSVSIKDNLYKLRNFEGASGKISIDDKGSSRTLESVFQIRDGKFVLVEE